MTSNVQLDSDSLEFSSLNELPINLNDTSSKPKILVVEDTPLMLKLTQMALKKIFKIIAVTNAQDAQNVWKEAVDKKNLLLLF